MRLVTRKATAPIPAHMAWRLNWKKGDSLNWCRLDTDEADSTITSPNRVRPTKVTVRKAA